MHNSKINLTNTILNLALIFTFMFLILQYFTQITIVLHCQLHKTAFNKVDYNIKSWVLLK